MSNGQRAMRDAGGDCARRCRIGVRHDSVIGIVTGSFAATAAQDDATGCVYGDAGLRAEGTKKERAPRGSTSWGVSRKAERCIKKKAPHEVYLMGGVNPAATYSPGPEGQVPSAI